MNLALESLSPKLEAWGPICTICLAADFGLHFWRIYSGLLFWKIYFGLLILEDLLFSFLPFWYRILLSVRCFCGFLKNV